MNNLLNRYGYKSYHPPRISIYTPLDYGVIQRDWTDVLGARNLIFAIISRMTITLKRELGAWGE